MPNYFHKGGQAEISIYFEVAEISIMLTVGAQLGNGNQACKYTVAALNHPIFFSD